MATSSLGFATGKGRRITASTSVKTVVTAPSPQPRATSAASVRPGRLANCRTANRTSCHRESRSHGQAHGKPCADPLSSWDGDRRVLVSTSRVGTVRMRTAPSLDWDDKRRSALTNGDCAG